MKTAGHDVIVEGATPVSQVIVYLEQLVAALKAGAVHVRHRDDEVVLGPREVVELAVHAKARAKRHKLSLELTWRWMQRVLNVAAVALIAVQDGHEPWQVDEILGARIGIFIGGSTEWKLATMAQWGAAAARRGAWCHVGRVNTRRRVLACAAAGVTSFDGTSVTKFPSTLPLLEAARDFGERQGDLLRSYHPIDPAVDAPITPRRSGRRGFDAQPAPRHGTTDEEP